jgi:hypothetical protein
MAEYAVEFTSENQGVCGGRCKKPFGATDEVFYLHNNDPTRPGRKVCRECHLHYIGKTTTRRITGTVPLF